MARDSADPTWLVIHGVLAGVGAFGVVAVVVASLVQGLSGVGLTILDAHAVPRVGIIADLSPLTWFGLPPVTLYALPPVAIATAGLIAARLTRSTDALIGILAGFPIAFGYAPFVILVAAALGLDVAMAAVIALTYALGFGALGGFIGVRT